MDIQELFQAENHIPSLPEIFYQVKSAIDDSSCSSYEIGKVVDNNPRLNARILKIVNSKFYDLPQAVESVSHALSLIDREQLSDLILSIVVIDQFRSIPKTSLDMKSFWRHSIACGLSARYLALATGEVNSDRFFVTGLLHDIGCIVMSLKTPFKLLEVSLRNESKGETLHKAEFEVLGFNHADVGAYLMKTWKLPKAIEESVGFHHNPAAATEFSLEASIIHVAETITNTLDLGFQYAEKSNIPAIDEYASEELLVPKDSLFLNIKKQVQKEFDQVEQVFLEPVKHGNLESLSSQNQLRVSA